MEGILGIDKPGGWTSHDVVARLRGISGIRRVGHAGTLDPMATGVLLCCLGPATRIVSFLTDADKEYRARIRLGVATDTHDAEGRVVGTSESLPTDPEVVARALSAFLGEIEQIPPMYSALKVGGRKLYEIARRGETVERAPRRVTIRELELVSFAPSVLDLRVACSKGTYIRSLADDLGRSLGCGGHVEALRRTRVGSMTLADCHPLEDAERAGREGRLAELMQPMDRALDHLPEVRLTVPRLRRFCSGAEVPLDRERAWGEATVRVYGEDGALYGLGITVGSGALRARSVFRDSGQNPEPTGSVLP